MSRRAIITLINFGFLAGTLVVWFVFSQYDDYALYALAAWVVISLTFAWSSRGPRPAGAVGGAPGAASSTTAAAGPRPAAPAPPVDFCVYCGTHFASGDRRCRSCGRPLPASPLPG